MDDLRHERGKRLWFDVAEVSVEDSIVGCELRLYQSSNLTRKINNNASYIVTIYQVVSDIKG